MYNHYLGAVSGLRSFVHGGKKGCQVKCLPENGSVVTKTIWHSSF